MVHVYHVCGGQSILLGAFLLGGGWGEVPALLSTRLPVGRVGGCLERGAKFLLGDPCLCQGLGGCSEALGGGVEPHPF